MEKEDFLQDQDIDILGVTKMDTESEEKQPVGGVLTESTSVVMAMANSEAMQELFA